MTRNRPPAPQGPTGPRVEPSEPEQERQLLTAAAEELSSDNYLTVFGIEALEAFMEDTGLTTNENGFIIVEETGEYAEPYTFDRHVFTDYEGVSDEHLLDYFNPVTEVTDYFRTQARLHITDLHGIIPGTKTTNHLHPVPDDIITISDYNHATGCTLPAVSAWSSLWENTWQQYEDAPTSQTLTVTHPLSGEKPDLTCLRCSFTGNASQWKTTKRREEQEVGFGHIHTCPECDCQWDTNSVYDCPDCDGVFSAEEYNYKGSGMHVESFCPACDAGPIRENREDRYDTEPLPNTEST